MDDEVVVEINADADLVAARAEARALAIRLGFSRTDATLIATAISEGGRGARRELATTASSSLPATRVPASVTSTRLSPRAMPHAEDLASAYPAPAA